MNKLISITLIILILIVLISAILYVINPTTKLINNINKINQTYYNYERNNKTIASYQGCKVAIYPTDHLKVPNFIEDVSNQNLIYLVIGDLQNRKSGSATISIIETNDDNNGIDEMNKISENKEPKVSRQLYVWNYFIYNERNYYYNIGPSRTLAITTPINDNYFYSVMISDYENLTKEDIESLLYFEIVK